jgi:cation transport ATPase
MPVGDVPEFGKAYEYARQAYGLSSGLLIAWELIGIKFSDTPLENLHVTLQSPQAIPYVLIALVAYFAFRITVEWYQTDQRRRQLLASKFDFWVAHAIAVTSLLLYGIQALLQFQLANKIKPPTLAAFFLGWLLGPLWPFYKGRSITQLWREDLVMSLFSLLMVLLTVTYGIFGALSGTLGVPLSSIAGAILGFVTQKLVKRLSGV